MRTDSIDSFFAKYSRFPKADNIDVDFLEDIKQEKWSEYDWSDKLVFVTDPFFSRTEYTIPVDQLPYLFLKLDLQHLALISTKLPTDLTNISQNEQLSLADKVAKAKEYINLTYGSDTGWIWKTKKVDWDLTHLSFYVHLWSKPQLVEQSMIFGLARTHSLHSRIIITPEMLKAMQRNMKIRALISLGLAIIHLALYFLAPNPAPTTTRGVEPNRKKINIIPESEEKVLDLNALRLTGNSEAAIHYLKSIQAAFDAQPKSKSIPNPADRIASLQVVILQDQKAASQNDNTFSCAPLWNFLSGRVRV